MGSTDEADFFGIDKSKCGLKPIAVENAIAHLDGFDLHALPAREATLALLVLALAQAAVAVEMHGAPVSPGTPYPNTRSGAAGCSALWLSPPRPRLRDPDAVCSPR